MQLPIYNPVDPSDAALIASVHAKKCPMVMRQNGNIIKIFYRKRLFSQRTLFPSGKRFVRNSFALIKREVATFQVDRYLRCPQGCCEVVIYPSLPGETLRERFEKEGVEILKTFARDLAKLHQRGIFFRGIHCGNILCNADQFALIDISDLKCTMGSLFSWQRARNLRHFLLYPEDSNIWTAANQKLFLSVYFETAQSLNDLPSTLSAWLKCYGVLVS